MTIPPVVREIFRDIGIAYLAVTHTVIHGEEVIEKISKLVGLKKEIERKFERRHTQMLTLATLAEVPQALNIVVTAIPKIQAAIPLIQKTVADINAAVADKQDPTKLTADLTNLLTDLTNDLSAISSLFPAPAPTTPAA